ncbi:MAG TPA: hypothetical protein VF585_07095 [Chthoniobacterales bacterium]|jgi:hypothetical protein
MSNDDPDRIWDEYDWERFMQDQDRKTEQYMELLEKYLDDPNRDQIIAREMGWTHLTDETGHNWADEAEMFLDAETIGDEISPEEDAAAFSSFETDPLYRACIELSGELGIALDENPSLQNHPLAIKMATHSAIGSAKLAAALNDDDLDEMGMTLAYLKRALRAITISLEALLELQKHALIDDHRGQILAQRVFQVRDGIVTKMGEIRREWRRRYEK